MPVVDAKCPNCSGAIQLDDSKTTGYCMHCGSQLEVEEAIQRVKLEGKVQVEGIASYEDLIKNGIIAMKLEEFDNAEHIFKQVTSIYPEDYKGWYYLARARTYFGNWTGVNDKISKPLKNAINTCNDSKKAQAFNDLRDTIINLRNVYRERTSLKYKLSTINDSKWWEVEEYYNGPGSIFLNGALKILMFFYLTLLGPFIFTVWLIDDKGWEPEHGLLITIAIPILVIVIIMILKNGLSSKVQKQIDTAENKLDYLRKDFVKQKNIAEALVNE